MIYDCFLFFNELDLLEIRLNILDEIVDKFVIVESNKTHSGKDKELIYEINQHRFEKFKSKIIHITVLDTPESNDNFFRQEWQRRSIIRGLGDCVEGDYVIVGDVDEIPNIEAIKKGIEINSFSKFKMMFFYYYMNAFINDEWLHSYILPFKQLKEQYHYSINLLRHSGTEHLIKDGGWHFSYFGGAEAVKEKLKAFGAAQAYSKKEILDNVSFAIENLVAPWDLLKENPIKNILEIDEKYPKYIRENEKELEEKGFIRKREISYHI